MDFRSPSTCSSSGNCVEVAEMWDGESFVIRNSSFPDHPWVCATKQEWTDFIAAVKAGEYDPRH